MTKFRHYVGVLAALAAVQVTAYAHAQAIPVCLGWTSFGLGEDVFERPRTQIMICSEGGENADATLTAKYVDVDNMLITFRTLDIQACGSGGYCIAQQGQNQYTLGPNDFRTMESQVDQVWLLSCYCD